MQFIGTKVYLISWLTASLVVWGDPVRSQPEPQIAEEWEAKAVNKIHKNLALPVPVGSLGKSRFLVHFYLEKDGSINHVHPLNKSGVQSTRVDTSQEDYARVKKALTAAIRASAPFQYPYMPHSTLRHIGVLYIYEPVTNQNGEVSLVHP